MIRQPRHRLSPGAMIAWFLGAMLMVSCDAGTGGQAEYVLVTLKNSQVSYESGNMFVSIYATGSWTLEIRYDDPSVEPWAELSKTSGTGSSNSIVLTYGRNETEQQRSLTVVLTSLGSTSEDRLIQLVKPEGPVEDPDYPGLISDAPRQWMELPAYTVESGCAWVFHNMSSTSTMRNYSLYYDVENRLSRWVAYPLNTGLIGSGSRVDLWEMQDPKIPYIYQPYTVLGWGTGKHDRGHQLPSADRLTANSSTFYPTNMTVQNPVLNQNTWRELEDQVRTWAQQSDTLYVVTGCVPSTEYITDRGGNRVNEPAAYYKALLRYSRASTISPWLGVAFYIQNEEHRDSYKLYALTIDELEEMVGIDFFPTLPSQYSSAESAINAWWGISQ